MKVLIIGGNGNIGYHCTMESLKLEYEVWSINRESDSFKHRNLPQNELLHVLNLDIRNVSLVKDTLKNEGFNENNKFDVIVDFTCMKSEHAHTAIELFNKITNHYIFISSTAVYKRPYDDVTADEYSELDYNTTWGYAYNKIQCEEIFKESYKNIEFPITIVRPAYTYDTTIPYAIGHDKGWTICQRILDGKQIVLLGDGTSLWSLSHSIDISKMIISLFGNPNAIKQTFNVVSNEYLTWKEITEIVANELCVKTLNIVYVPTNYILRNKLDVGIHLYHHRMWNDLYCNNKIKNFINCKTSYSYEPQIRFKDGIKRTIKWFNEDDRRKWINDDLNKFIDETCKKFSRL